MARYEVRLEVPNESNSLVQVLSPLTGLASEYIVPLFDVNLGLRENTVVFEYFEGETLAERFTRR